MSARVVDAWKPLAATILVRLSGAGLVALVVGFAVGRRLGAFADGERELLANGGALLFEVQRAPAGWGMQLDVVFLGIALLSAPITLVLTGAVIRSLAAPRSSLRDAVGQGWSRLLVLVGLLVIALVTGGLLLWLGLFARDALLAWLDTAPQTHALFAVLSAAAALALPLASCAAHDAMRVVAIAEGRGLLGSISGGLGLLWRNKWQLVRAYAAYVFVSATIVAASLAALLVLAFGSQSAFVGAACAEAALAAALVIFRGRWLAKLVTLRTDQALRDPEGMEYVPAPSAGEAPR
jgi:hypothetical protein